MATDPELKKKVEEALKEACGPDQKHEIQLEDVPPDKVAGQVLSDSFSSLSPSERQDLIWKYLDKALNPFERTRVSFIVTDTPSEYRVLTGSS
jgi:hypothetical protein